MACDGAWTVSIAGAREFFLSAAWAVLPSPSGKRECRNGCAGWTLSAINRPFFLCENVSEYDRSKKYVIYCTTGERGGAFILGKADFEVFALQGAIY